MENKKYWLQREKQWIAQNLKSDEEFAKRIEAHYQKALKQINDDIQKFYFNYAHSAGISMEDAIKQVSQFDVKAFEKTAAKMVKDKDLSAYANAKLKLYNATMRINRLEYLKSEIGLALLDTHSDIEQMMNQKLNDEYRAERKRQSGILGYHNQNDDIADRIEKVVNADFHGATWSQRIWVNNNALQAQLDDLLTKSMIQGAGPEEIARKLRGLVSDKIKNTTYVTQRLARTETARVQDIAQNDSFKKMGIEYVKWVYEPTACPLCIDVGEAHDGIYKLTKSPGIPMHPNCRCSKAAYMPNENEDGIEEPNKLTSDELRALNKYLSFDSYGLNAALRQGIPLTDMQEEWANNLDKALNKLPVYKGKNLIHSFTKFRDTKDMYDLLNQLYENEEFNPQSYLSASKTVFDPNDSIRMIIKKSHSGHDLKGYNDIEQEVLFKRGTKFRILDMYLDNDNKPIIVVEEE